MNLSVAASLLFGADEVLIRGFETIAGLPAITDDDYTEQNIRIFKAFFGPTPSTICFVWQDILQSKNEELGLHPSDKSEKGFKRLLIALHFLWAYPKNAIILANTTGTSERMVQGEFLW
ncbi:unnamed protein product, partial [Cylindrotheca closterium]